MKLQPTRPTASWVRYLGRFIIGKKLTWSLSSKLSLGQNWSTRWLAKDIAVLEKVQERLVRMISDAKGKTYEEKLSDIDLTTLKERRERGDLILTFKVIKGLDRADKHEWFKMVEEDVNPRATRSTTSVSEEGQIRRNDKLFRGHARLESRSNFFCQRVVKKWNALPDAIRNQESLNAFKNAYDRWSLENR